MKPNSGLSGGTTSTLAGDCSIRATSAGRSAGLVQLDAHQGRAGLPVVALDVLEQGDVVLRPEHLVEEPPQRTRLLGELDQEVVLEPLEDQRPLDDLGVPADVVVAAGDHADHGRARGEVELEVRAPRWQRTGGLGDDAVGLVQRRASRHTPAPPARRPGPAAAGRDGRERHSRPLAAPRRRRRTCRGPRGRPASRRPPRRHAGGARRLDADHRTPGCASPQPGERAGDQPAAADRTTIDVGRRGELLDDLAGDGALAGDRAGVVEGRDERRAGPLRERSAAAAAASS